MEKGDWGADLVEACCCTPSSAVYCGVSAGAILIGNSMQTACWKGWDDPSVVPGREAYDDWKDVKGLGLAGSVSFFPHMEDQWQPMVDDRVRELPPAGDFESPVLCCLADDQVCYVDGCATSIQSTGVLSSGLQPARL
jgi:hypothetical protein